MDPYRYFMFNQRSMVVLGILQMACAGLCLVCGFVDVAFRKDTALSATRSPFWTSMIMAIPGILALFSSQKKNPVLVNVMIAMSVFSCFTTLIAVVYACLTLSYGEDDDELLHYSHIDHPQAKFILGNLVKGANVTMLLGCLCSIILLVLISVLGCRSLPFCGCYDGSTGLETLVPQDESRLQTELVCTWQKTDDRIFNSAVPCAMDQEQEEEPSKPPPYIRLA